MQTMRLRSVTVRTLSIFGCAGALALAASCDSFLDPKPNDVLAPENFYKTSTDAVASVNGVYTAAKGSRWLDYWYLSDVATDDILASPNFGSDGHRMSNYIFDSRDDFPIGSAWGNAYSTINRANAVLDRVPGISMDVALRDRLIGEAKLLRALSYLDLVRFFGDVPLIDHEVTSLSGLEIPRTPAAQVWALIESDLQAAADILPPSYSGSDVGRATKGAALALLAKARLHQQNWAGAAQAAGEIIASGQYSLLPTWRNNFKIATKLINTESIFEFNFDPVQDPGGGSIHTLFSLPSGYPGGDAYGLMQLMPSLVSSFAAGDTRGNHGTFMLSPYTDADGRTVTWTVPAGAAFAKYLDETDAQNMTKRGWVQQGNSWIVERYADVLLMYAEAVNEGGTAIAGKTKEQALNEVRQRAGLLPVGALSAGAFRDSVRIERRKEFVFEGQRWFDLSRWNTLDAAILAKTQELQTVYPGEATVHGVPSNLFPIPQSELDINPALTQNPGWS
jgi:starch-binding outer membrane protein, SusD/RagB family